MPNYLEIIRLHELSFSQRKICETVGSGRTLVKRTIDTAKQNQLSYQTLRSWDADRISEVFDVRKNQSKKIVRDEVFTMPDYKELSKSLSQPGVTMKLLWEEYVHACRLSNKPYYQLTQFRKYFNEYLSKQSFSEIIHHKAGERVEVDWAGSKIRWIDPTTGEVIYGYLFVAVLPFSGYAFAYGCTDMKQENWIKAHVEMFDYFRGVPTLLVSDNLKTGVIKNSKKGIVLNRSYEDLANHYRTIIMPTRVRKPKDKATVENTVKQLTTYIIAKMRNYQCFSIEQYNELLMLELEKFNKKPFQKKNGSRFTLFEEHERFALQSLPDYKYEFCEYKTAKVFANSHISYKKHNYSVPHQYIGDTVQLKISKNIIKIYKNKELLCEHSTLYKNPGGYTSINEHFPVNSSTHGEWNSKRYIKWASRIGPNTRIVVEKMFEDGPEQRHYKRVHSLLKLADKYTDRTLDNACLISLEKSMNPGVNLIKNILSSGAFQLDSNIGNAPEQSFLRGANYYDK